jgi:hypothetical protein
VPKCGLPPPIECIRRRCCVTDRSWASALSCGDVKIWSASIVGLAWSAPVSLCRPFDAWDARRAARTPTGCGDAYGTRIRTQLYFKCYCACRRHQGCHCRETETLVRLRFSGSSRTSRCLPVPGHMGCGPQSAMAGGKLNAGHLLGVLP